MKAPGPPTWVVHAGGVAACLGLLALAWFAGVRPLHAERAQRLALASSLDQALEQALDLAAQRRSLEAQIRSVREGLREEVVHLEPSDRLNRRLSDITELLARHGLDLHETKTGMVRRERYHDSVPLTFVGAGEYSDVAACMHELRLTMPDVSVVGFELSGNPREPESPDLFEFDLVWFADSAVASAPDS